MSSEAVLQVGHATAEVEGGTSANPANATVKVTRLGRRARQRAPRAACAPRVAASCATSASAPSNAACRAGARRSRRGPGAVEVAVGVEQVRLERRALVAEGRTRPRFIIRRSARAASATRTAYTPSGGRSFRGDARHEVERREAEQPPALLAARRRVPRDRVAAVRARTRRASRSPAATRCRIVRGRDRHAVRRRRPAARRRPRSRASRRAR